MWDLTFGLALTAGGLAMVLIVFWAISPPVSLASIKRAPTIRPSRIAAAAPQNQDDWVCSKVAKTAPEPITKKLVAIVPANAPKHSVAAEVEVVKVRPAPGQEAETPKKHPPAPVAFSMKRRQNRSEEELRRELLQVAEVSLPRQVPVRQGNLGQPTFVIAGLPWRRGADCRLGKEPAENLQLFSQRIRTFFQQDSGDRADCLRQKLFADEESCRSPEAIPALVQMLQVENKSARLVLIEALSGIDGLEATHALAKRALYDLSPAVRQAAVKALRHRPEKDYRDQLLGGLQYPWPAVADHAAEALAALNVQSALPVLMNILEKPAGEKGMGKTPMIKELVKINHQRNCMLCHPASFSPGDPVRGAVPLPGQSQAQGYAQGQFFIRADVTYLQQDFSVMQPEGHFGPGPAFQRYDYVLRSRPATGKDLQQRFRQRRAILFALKELIGSAGEPMHLHQALLREEENRVQTAEIAFWKAQAEQLAKEKANLDKIQKKANPERQVDQHPLPVSRETLRFNVDSIPWPVVFKEDRKLGSRVRVLAQFLERLDDNPGAQELVWTIKEALQALEGLRAGLDRYPITHLHANEARNFLDGIETSLWALKRFI